MKTWISVLLVVLLAGSSIAAAGWNDPTPTPSWLEALQKQTHLEFSLGGCVSGSRSGGMVLPPGVRDIPEYQRDHVDYEDTTAIAKLESDSDGCWLARVGLNPLPVSWLSGLLAGFEVDWWNGGGYTARERYSEGAGSESYVCAILRVDHPFLCRGFLGWQQPLRRSYDPGDEGSSLLEVGVEYLFTDQVDIEVDQGWNRYSHYTSLRRLPGQLRSSTRLFPFLSLKALVFPFVIQFFVRSAVNWDAQIEFEDEVHRTKIDRGAIEFGFRLGGAWKAWYK